MKPYASPIMDRNKKPAQDDDTAILDDELRTLYTLCIVLVNMPVLRVNFEKNSAFIVNVYLTVMGIITTSKVV